MDMGKLPDELKIYTLKNVAEILGVSERTVHRYIKEGRLEAMKMGQWRISQKAISDFLERGKTLRDNLLMERYGQAKSGKDEQADTTTGRI